MIVFREILIFISSRKAVESIFYISASGGYGQIYDLAFITIARFKGMKLYIHHHSFSYINKFRIVTWLMTFLSGLNSTHILLSESMARKFCHKYRFFGNKIVMSNAFFINANSQPSSLNHSSLKTIGFFSNVSREKGIFVFLELASIYLKLNSNLVFKIAGPIQNDKYEKRVLEIISTLPNVEYLGPLYADKRTLFLRTIDLLIFPTLHEHEAEPLVIYECMQAAVPVLTTARGCIPEMITNESGYVLNLDGNFVSRSIVIINNLVSNPSKYALLSKCALRQFANKNNKAEFNNFFNSLGSL
jgi:glycosyltransferase involved in cell wall biosynthesis